MSGPMQGHDELVIAIVSLALAVISVVALVSRRGATTWFTGVVLALAAMMGLLSFV